MKRLFTLLILLSPVMLVAQDSPKRIEGFYGIKFGSTKAQSMETMKAKGAVQDVPLTTENRVVYKSLTFAGRKSNLAAIYFVDDKLYQGTVFFIANNDNEALKLFDEVVNEIGELYPSQDVFKSFKSPYEEGDGHEVTAIKLGYATYTAFWNTPGSGESENFVSLEVTTEMNLKLTYQDGNLIKIVGERSKAKKAKDY